ncbi:hypothetical protein MHF_1157 [Mycoplasma haemofelis Ohio2]|uniref:Uncharacterized protein n=1 Tax=Mycoplasma haemofelis (strain Ohio2) TaxID=859194 RepID=F6FJP4_MYCHI|nr:hypothetical protein MHF_1157 [Mycoplasma haemofelis Ohio2]
MSYGLLKLAALGGVGAAGGGIAASSSVFSGSKGESITYKTTPSKVAEEGSVPESSVEQRDETPTVTRKCVIFVTDEATGTREGMKITKILERYEDSESFLTKVEDNGNASFKGDVKGACEGRKPDNHPQGKDVTVYVYKKETGGLWNYTQFLQKQDWSKNPAIKQNSSGVNLD